MCDNDAPDLRSEISTNINGDFNENHNLSLFHLNYSNEYTTTNPNSLAS